MRANSTKAIVLAITRAIRARATAVCIPCAVGTCVDCRSGDSTHSTQDAASSSPQPCTGLPVLTQSPRAIGFVQVYEPGNPWTAANTADLIQQAEKRGYTLVYRPATESGPKGQLERMQALIEAKVDVIVVRPLDATSLVPQVLAARNACIPVFTVNRFLDATQAAPGRDYVTGIAADAIVQGQMIADWLSKAMAGKAQIVELEGPPGVSSAVGRKKGFEDRIAREPGMHVVASKTANYDRVAGHDVAKDLLVKCTQCNAIFAHNDNMALGALTAIRELGKTPGKDVIVVGVDGLKEAVQQIIEGTMGATVFNEPRFGAITLTTIEKYAAGHTVDPTVVVKGPVIDRTNAPAMIAEAF